jgi:hypothetical protein
MNYPQFWLNASPTRKKIYSIIFMFILAVLATVIGVLIPVDPTEAKMISDQLNQTVTSGTANGTLIPDIFINNWSICLLMFVPIAGAAAGLFILFSTGQAFRAIFQIQAAGIVANPSATPTPLPSISPTTAVIALGLIGVVFLLEYVSYTIAMTESIWLGRRILQWLEGRRRNELKPEIKYLLIFIGIVSLLLIIGAVVETYTLSIGV